MRWVPYASIYRLTEKTGTPHKIFRKAVQLNGVRNVVHHEWNVRGPYSIAHPALMGFANGNKNVASELVSLSLSRSCTVCGGSVIGSSHIWNHGECLHHRNHVLAYIRFVHDTLINYQVGAWFVALFDHKNTTCRSILSSTHHCRQRYVLPGVIAIIATCRKTIYEIAVAQLWLNAISIDKNISWLWTLYRHYTRVWP